MCVSRGHHAHFLLLGFLREVYFKICNYSLPFQVSFPMYWVSNHHQMEVLTKWGMNCIDKHLLPSYTVCCVDSTTNRYVLQKCHGLPISSDFLISLLQVTRNQSLCFLFFMQHLKLINCPGHQSEWKMLETTLLPWKCQTGWLEQDCQPC